MVMPDTVIPFEMDGIKCVRQPVWLMSKRYLGDTSILKDLVSSMFPEVMFIPSHTTRIPIVRLKVMMTIILTAFICITADYPDAARIQFNPVNEKYFFK